MVIFRDHRLILCAGSNSCSFYLNINNILAKMISPIWSQGSEGIELMPGGNFEGVNCLATCANNDIVFWNNRGFGVCSLNDIALRNSTCKQFTFLTSM